ncbi:MAG: apolipoprotein N-acyltransferase [Flavobacteriales bacterium]|nr:MAG: apolipoprotein N-acyltransferase [Flavobacteriales bacterium]
MKNLLFSLISGLLLAIAWPTYGIPFFIFFALVPLLMAEHNISLFSELKRKGWAVFGLSYLTFFIWNVVTTGWLYGAKNPDGSNAILAVAIPILANSLLYSLVFTLYHRYKKTQGTYWGLVFLVCIWIGFEKFHLEWELSWAWLNLGNVFAENPKIIQWYDTVGATGGSLWILLINIFIFYTIRIWEAGRKLNALLKNIAILSGLILIPIFISLWKYYDFNEKPIGEVKVLMLQPNLDPYVEKYTKDSLSISNELLNLAEENSAGKIDFYIAPETAIPGRGSLSERGFKNSEIIRKIKNFTQRHPESNFLTGASTHRFYFNENEKTDNAYLVSPNTWVESYNTALQINTQPEIETYHKGKLVPGVEIFPYINVLKPILGDAMFDFGGTTASLGIDQERKAFDNPYNKGQPAPIICYESIYGEFVTEYVKKGANFLTIMTNDSWWGVSEGHRQLLAYASLRAIETRREIARSANTGISAHINAKGEVIEDTLYGDKTALFSKIKLYDILTPYAKTGDVLSRICILILGFLLFYPIAKKVKEKIVK